MKTVFFLGGGRITNAIATGLKPRAFPHQIVVYDRNLPKLRHFQKHTNARITTDLRKVNDADLLVIAVRPQSAEQAIRELGLVSRKLPALSLCAGVSLRRLQDWSNGAKASLIWARAMPSPACSTGNGLTALCYSRRFPADSKKLVAKLFQQVGAMVELSESQIDPFTVAFSPTHGQKALATLTKAAEEIGLDSKTALLAAAHALGDSLNDWRARGMPDPSEMLEEAATPGGIAAATMAAMDGAGYQLAVQRGVRAGMKQMDKIVKEES